MRLYPFRRKLSISGSRSLTFLTTTIPLFYRSIFTTVVRSSSRSQLRFILETIIATEPSPLYDRCKQQQQQQGVFPYLPISKTEASARPGPGPQCMMSTSSLLGRCTR